MITNRYWEKDMGETHIPYQAPGMLEHYDAYNVLEEYEQILLLTPSGQLGDEYLNQTSWYSEPLSMLLWALNLIEFPEQSDGVSLMIGSTIYDHELETITLRSETEIRDALSSQF